MEPRSGLVFPSFRRKLSYMRCSPSARMLAASVLVFSSVILYLSLHVPQTCQPCNLAATQDKDGPLPHEQSLRHDNAAPADVNSKPPSAPTPNTTGMKPPTAPEKKQGSKVVLLSKAEDEVIKKGVPEKPTKASVKPKRKFRNPPVPERPDISVAEQAKHKLAIIIPYRDRMENLQVFVPTVSKILEEQNIKFAIYVVDQTEMGAFNRGKLCNIGFQLAEKDGYDYIAIHDVDKLPVSANVSYRWPGDTFVHMATCVEQFKYELPYYNFLGGVVMFKMVDYRKFNGMTNIFWGFGAEDDDLWVRIKRKRLRISRAKECDRGRFVSLNHGNSSLYYPKVEYTVNYNLYRQLLKRRRQMETDGLSSLEYKLISRTQETLGYVNLTVNLCVGPLGRATIEETGCDGPKPRPPNTPKSVPS